MVLRELTNNGSSSSSSRTHTTVLLQRVGVAETLAQRQQQPQSQRRWQLQGSSSARQEDV
jgi:hypothetical protein